ncbi:MAG TPA: GNAT family N-acetyltransferase [Gaiellaceae bacterium]
MAVESEVPTVVVLDAKVEDAAAITAVGADAYRLLHEAWFEMATIETIVEQIYSVESLENCIACCRGSADAHFLVAYSGNELAGFLHYDSFGPEPELHRIYVRPEVKRAGVGSTLMATLHDRLRPGDSYMLLVAAANEPAITFYRRHGLSERRRVVDGLEAFRDHMGVALPPDLAPVEALVMAYVKPGATVKPRGAMPMPLTR